MHKRRNNKIYSLTYGTQHIYTALGDLEVELFRNYEPCKLGESIWTTTSFTKQTFTFKYYFETPDQMI